MSNKDSDWDLEDEKEFGQELDQSSGQNDPYQDNIAGQEGYDPATGSQDFDQPYDPTQGYAATPADDPTQVTADTPDTYQEYGTEEFSGDDSDFDDYDFMDDTSPTADAYTDDVAAYTDGDDDFSADEFSEYGDDPVDLPPREPRSYMDKGMGGEKKPIGMIAIIAVAGVLVLGGSYFAFTSLFGGSDTPAQRPVQIDAQNDNFSDDGTGAFAKNETAEPEPAFDDGIRPPAFEQNDTSAQNAAANDPGPLTPLPGEEENIGFFTAGNDTEDEGGIQFDVPDTQGQDEDDMFASIEDPQPQSAPQEEAEDLTEELDITEAATDFFDTLEEPAQETMNEPAPVPVPQETNTPAPSTSQESQQMSGNTPASSEVLSQLQELNSNISQLNQRIGTLEDRIETVEANLNSRISALEKRPAADTQPSTPSSITEKTPSKQPAATAPTPKRETAPAPAARASSWEIRAIQVGKAVVAQRGTQGSREISVGDSLPGLGTIQAIDYRNGQWVISGTQGTIRE